MSHYIPSLSPARARQPRPKSDWERRTERSILIGLLCTLLFHVLLFTLAPLFPTEKFVGTHSNLEAVLARKNKSFDFQLVNPPPPPPAQANPFRYVETNPEAPANEPDKTDNFSNRNQQSAQAEAAREKDPENRPSVRGQDEVKNDTAIVSGERAQPQPGAAVTPLPAQHPAESPQEAQPARAEQVPLDGSEERQGKNTEGIGTGKARHQAPTTQAEQFREGARDSQNESGAATATAKQTTTKAQPKPRPRLSAARSTILTNRIAGTPNVGVLGIDARWSEYGDYMNELIEIIDAEWHKIVEGSSIYPKPGSHVIVTFRLNADGAAVVQSVEETSGTLGVGQCTTAITSRQPYRKWSDAMIAVLGREQSITFGFYYY